MYHSGIGGGGFMLVRDKDGKYEAIDFRESAPAAAYEDMYRGNVNGSIYGGLSVCLAKSVASSTRIRNTVYEPQTPFHSFYKANKHTQSLPWKTILQGAIKIARDGFIGKSESNHIEQPG